nr:hypothetical protein [Tanacetum cinerariifolium]
MSFGAYEDERVVGIITRAARGCYCKTKYHMGKGKCSCDAWSKKGGVKSRRVRDICRTIQAKVSKKMLVVLIETFKAEDASTEMLRGLEQLVERKEDGGLYF